MKKVLALLLCVVIIFSFSSCSSGRSLSDKSVAQAVSIDLVDKETVVGIQYLDLSKGTATADGFDNNITSVATGQADNISSAVSKASASLSGPIFFGQNKLIVFGKEYAKLGIGGISDYILRGIDSRPDVLVAICDSSAKDVVSSKENNAKVPAESLYNMIKTGESVGLSIKVNVNDLLNMYNSKTSDVYLPCLTVNDDKTSCDGIMLFSEQEPACILDDDETFGFLLLKDAIKGGMLSSYDEKLGNVGFEIKSTNLKRKTYFKNNEIHFDVNLKLKLVLNDVQNGVAVKISADDVSRLEKIASQKAESLCNAAVGRCLTDKSDALSLGRELAKYSPVKYDEIKNSWHDELPNIKYDINVSSKLEFVSDNSIRK